ncbi:MAG: peroxide stress protein YaaA [Bacteroidota bacterium]
MLFVISPAKKLDLSEETRFSEVHSQPRLMKDSQVLVNSLSKMSANKLGKLMHISDNLANLNYERYQSYEAPFSAANAKQALFSFKGEVYLSFELEQYGEEEFAYAQDNLRILSGLYGLLKPLDLMQPYRLEMGTKMKTRRGKNLYEFWGSRITKLLKDDLKERGTDTLINLASNEYFKSIKPKELNANIITPVFKEERDGKFKAIFLYAKQARGLMCDFAIKEKVQNPEDLKDFQGMGYQFNESLSSDNEWVFSRVS